MKPHWRWCLLSAAALAAATGMLPARSATAASDAARIASAAAFKPGPFRPDERVAAAYRFGWSGIEAARGGVTLDGNGFGGTSTLSGGARTTGFARTLWSMDAALEATTAPSCMPVFLRQTERHRGGRERSIEITFDDGRFSTWRWDEPKEKRPDTPKIVRQAGVHSLHSALLALRSVNWESSPRAALLVTPGKTIYLLDAEFLRKESLRGGFGEANAFLLDVRLGKLRKDGRIEPHGKVRNIRVWLSADSARIPLRIEGDVFIGYVFAEMTSP